MTNKTSLNQTAAYENAKIELGWDRPPVELEHLLHLQGRVNALEDQNKKLVDWAKILEDDLNWLLRIIVTQWRP